MVSIESTESTKIKNYSIDSVDPVKKPASLSLGKDTPSKKAAPHFSQLVKSDDTITKHPEQVPPSPKTVRQIALRDSRSPSPATVAVSRKSSFCSLFKSKEVTASPDLQIPGPPQDPHSTSAEERCGSSKSELDSELTAKQLCNAVGSIEEESARLVEQGSFDELPYVPTTLPEERPVGIAIVPVKERSLMDVKTCPVERPRSTTPLNPCHLEEYCGSVPQVDDHDGGIVRGENLRISLPRKEAKEKAAKSPRRISNTSGKRTNEFHTHSRTTFGYSG